MTDVKVIQPDPEQECSFCGVTNLELHCYPPEPQHQVQEDVDLCWLCEQLSESNKLRYPRQMGEAFRIAQTVARVANLMLQRIAKGDAT